jgi:hypothetical protein
VAGVLLVALAASGAWLWWEYRPDREHWVGVVHEAAAVGLLAVAVVLVALAVVRRGVAGAPGVLAGAGVLVTVGAAYVLGRLLPWDQVALASAGSSAEAGVALTFDSAVRSVVLDGRVVSPSTYHWWAWAHVALSALAVVALGLLWLRTRDAPVSRREPAPTPAPGSER